MQFEYITTDSLLQKKLEDYSRRKVSTIAMDFEEESNLHVFGEHLCIIQVYDGSGYAIIDALQLSKQALDSFLSSPIEKIMFDCGSDCSLCRKSLGIQVQNVYDVRLDALALGFTGNLTSVEREVLGIDTEDPSLKKRYQKANWMKRPIAQAQLEYALGDVEHLFDLKEKLGERVLALDSQVQKDLRKDQASCALQKNPERPGWEKICNYKLLRKDQRIMIKHLFLARQDIAMKRNVPASWVLEKGLIVQMACSMALSEQVPANLKSHFQNAIDNAREELSGPASAHKSS